VIAADFSGSLTYRQQQLEGRRQRDRTVVFDRHTNSARTTNNGKLLQPLPVPPGTFDPLGAMYALRGRDYTLHQTVDLPISDGKRCAVGRATIIGEDTVRTPAGRFETWILEPELKDVGGVFEKSPGAKVHLWFSKDARHIPIKVASRVIVGSFTAELIRIESAATAASSTAVEEE
jgi:hypothetical protein